MFKFIVRFISGFQTEVHFDGGEGAKWSSQLKTFRNGSIETIYCHRLKEYIKINWDNVELISPVPEVVTTKKGSK